MEPRRLILYDFFQRLRQEVGLELDPDQYLDFLRSFLSGIIAPEASSDIQAFREELRSLCRIHWLTHPRRFGAAFDRLFEEEFDKLIRFQPAIPEEPAAAPEPTEAQEFVQKQSGAPQQTAPPEPSKKKPPLPPSQKEPAPEAMTDLFLRFKTAAGTGRAGPAQDRPAQLLDNKFLFSDRHLPASDRRLQQHWRYLGAFAESRAGVDIDIASTVAAFAEKGFIVEPVFQKEKIYRQQTVFLIDDGGSMLAFASLADHLVSTIRSSLEGGPVSVYYFHNNPGGPLFRERNRSAPVERETFIREALHTASFLIIISDAGAARGTVHNERIQQTKRFLVDARKKVPHLLWMNPVPKERWANSTAMYVSLYVDMLEASAQGLRRLPHILRHL